MISEQDAKGQALLVHAKQHLEQPRYAVLVALNTLTLLTCNGKWYYLHIGKILYARNHLGTLPPYLASRNFSTFLYGQSNL